MLGLSVVPLLWKTEQEVEDLVEVVSNSAQRVVLELEEGSAEVIRSFFSFFGAAVVAVGAVCLWVLGRKAMNVMAHIVYGNTLPAKLVELKDGESSWEVQGLSSKRTHRVWLGGGRDESGLVGACACRAFLESGTCGHVDAAVEAAKAMGLRREGVKAVGFKEPVAAVKAKEVLRSAGSPTAPALGTASAECLVGVFHKAKQGCFPARLQKASKAEPPAREALAIADVPTGQRGAASGALLRPTGAEHDGRGWSPVSARFLKDDSTFRFLVERIEGLSSQAQVFIRCYSFDQPDVVHAVGAFLRRGGKASLVADRAQSAGRTKSQLQVLKSLSSEGARVKLAVGHLVGDAYVSDNRSTKVGTGLKGLHHCKSVLLLPDEEEKPAVIVAGSCNFTTSSKANQEISYALEVACGSPLVGEWLDAFRESFNGGITIDEVESLSVKPKQQAQAAPATPQ